MTTIPFWIRRHEARLLVMVLIGTLYILSRQPTLSSHEQEKLSHNFVFMEYPLPVVTASNRTVRPVNPGMERISGWISSVGASVALSDLDGDGLPNDLCYVNTRTDEVTILPVPGTGHRYQPFILQCPRKLGYNPDTMAPMGCLPGDFNEDGLTDVLVYYWGRTPVIFLRRPGTPMTASSYVAQEVVPGGERWYTNAVTQADIDGDGHVDLVIGNYFPDGSRILDTRACASDSMQTSMARGFNGGGLRLLRWHLATGGTHPSVCFEKPLVIADVLVTPPSKGSPDRDAAEKLGHGWTLALGAADLDGDLLPEIYEVNDFGPDHLFHNESIPGQFHFRPLLGRKGFTTPSSKVLGQDGFKGMGVCFGDLFSRGLLDIFVSNITESYALEESNQVFINTGELSCIRDGAAPFVDRSEPLGLARSGWSWDAKLADLDNDGSLEVLQATGFVKGRVNRWPELQETAMGNPWFLNDPRSWFRCGPANGIHGADGLSDHDHNPVYTLGGDNRYHDVAPLSQVIPCGSGPSGKRVCFHDPQISRGIAVADVDGDGWLDYAVANQWETSYFYHNRGSIRTTEYYSDQKSPNLGAFLGLNILLPLHPCIPAATRCYTGHPGPGLSGRPAIGASVTLVVREHGRIAATMLSQVDGGNGHSGKSSPQVHFGLGRYHYDPTLEVIIRWRYPGSQAVQHQELWLKPRQWYTVLLGCNTQED